MDYCAVLHYLLSHASVVIPKQKYAQICKSHTLCVGHTHRCLCSVEI